MKRCLLWLICAVILFCLVSCGSSSSLSDVLNEFNSNESQSESQNSDDQKDKLTVKDVIKVKYEKSGSYVSGNKKSEYSYKYPEIILSDEAFSEFNEQISNYCQALIDVELDQMNNGEDIGLTVMDYTVCLKGDILSVLIRSQYGFDHTLFETVNVNVKTGEELENDAILNAAGLSSEDGEKKIQTAAENKYIQIHGTVSDRDVDETVEYGRGKTATLLDYNDDMSLFFGENGGLKAIVRVYELGGEKYEYYEVSVK